MPRQKQSYKYIGSARDLTIVEQEDVEIGTRSRYQWSAPHQVRYAVVWDEGILARTVERAHRHRNGRSTAGPVTIVVHPDDRHPEKQP